MYEIAFKKIRFLNNIADSITNYGEQCGYSNLFDLVDMNCGAVPEGEFGQVIDPGAPEEFLKLYMHIAQARFAFAVKEVLRINEKCLPPIVQFLQQVAMQNKAGDNGGSLNSAQDALDFYDLFVLDSIGPTTAENGNEFLCKTDSEITWKKVIDENAAAWKKFDGDLTIYNKLLCVFVNGLFEDTGFVFAAEVGEDGCRVCSIKKKIN